MQVNITNGTLTQLQETLSPNQYYALPSSVLVSGASSLYVGGTITLTDITASVSITANGKLLTYPSFRDIKITDNTDYITFNLDGVDFDLLLDTTPSVDPILANNEWSVIKSVCQSGQAGNYWAVGDTKNVTGGDNAVRPVMIVDMQGLYSKHVVFQFRYRTEQNYVWQGSANDGDYYNNYNLATIRTTINSGGNAYTELFSSDLGQELTNTTVKVAKNGGDGTLVDVTDKVFLPAEKEVWTSRTYSRTEEFTALTTFQYYTTHTSNSDHMIPRPSAVGQTSGNVWWLRSPCSDYSNGVCGVNSSGGASNYDADDSRGVAPCFAF